MNTQQNSDPTDLKYKAIADRLRAEDHAEREAERKRKAGLTGDRRALSVAAYMNTSAGHEAIQAERTRIKMILSHPEAEGRERLAVELACSSDMGVEAIGRVLATAPRDLAIEERLEVERILALAGGCLPQSALSEEEAEVQSILALTDPTRGQ